MAATTTAIRNSVYVKLDASEGGEKTIIKSVSLGTLNPSAFDAQKAINIINLLMPCLEYPLDSIQQLVTNKLSMSA